MAGGCQLIMFLMVNANALTYRQCSCLIKNEQQSLVMSLQDSQQAANLASFVVTGSMLESRLTQRLLSYSPNYRGVAEPDAIVVTSSQPLTSL
jgi:hypothetical protein